MKTDAGHCDVLQTLEGAGLQKTSQRKAVLDIIIHSDYPLNANEILKRVKDKQKINRVTIYRILTSFKLKGIIREIETGRGINYYEMACNHNPIHPHFNCRLCGNMICMSPLTVSQAWDWFARPYNFSIDHINVNITGVCNRCQERKDRNPVASNKKEKR